MAQNQPANVQNPGPINRNMPNTIGATGGLRLPRWPLLSALFCILLVCIGYVLWNIVPCTTLPLLNSFCHIDSWPAFVTVLVLWLLFVCGWVGAWCFGASIQEPYPQRGPIGTWLRALSDFEALRPLIIIASGIALGMSLLMLLLGRMQPFLFALACILAFVGIWTYLYRPTQQTVQQTAQAQQNQSLARTGSPLFRLRSLPVIGYVWPNRP